MSYYTIDPVVNGQRKQQVVKVGDTLPIGAIIGFDTTGTIPDGWEYYAENQIKKIAPVTPPNGNIKNSYGTSQTDTYSQEYQNEHNVIVSADTPTTSERVWFKKSKNLFIPTLTNNGININVNAATISLNADEYSFICSGSDMYFGQVKSSGADYNDNCGTLYKVTPGETIKVLVTGTGFNSIFITKYTNSKVSLGYENIASNTASLVIPENCYYVTIRFGVRSATSGTTYKARVMMAKTTETITYEPYHLPDIYVDSEKITENVKVGTEGNNSRVWFKQGKNIIDTKDYIASTTTNGITYSNNGDGTFSLSGTATADTTIVIIPIGKIDLKASQPYYLYSSEPYNNQTFNLSVIYNDNGIKYLVANNTVTPTNTPTSVRLSFYIANGKTVNAENVRLKLLENSKYITPSINVDNEEICNLQTYSNYSIINGLKLCYGEVSSGSVSANTGKNLSVDLPTTYNDANYKVIASINTGSAYWSELNLTAHANTTSKIEISLWNNGANATDCTISYIVIGK